MSKQQILLSSLVVVALLAPGVILAQPAAPQAAPTPEPQAGAILFVENAGQWPDAARFRVWGGPGTMWLAKDAIWITVESRQVDKREQEGCDNPLIYLPTCLPSPRRGVNLKLSFPGSNPDVRIEPFDPLTTTVSYFLGNDPDQWQPAVPVWGGVRYVDLCPGVDLELTSEGGRMAQRLVVQPDADVSAVQLQVAGAELRGVEGRTLHLVSAAGDLALPLPGASFSLTIVGEAETGQTSTWTAAPGSAPDVDAALPAPSALTPTDNPTDLLYSTFLGGTGFYGDSGSGIAVDGTGSPYVTGSTGSSNFPTTPGAFDPSFSGGYGDAFVVKLNPASSGLAYATFLGGSDLDSGSAIAVDGAGSAYVTGYTHSIGFPTTPGAFDPSFNYGYNDAFVVKLNPTGSGLEYGTFLGGSGSNGDTGAAIAVDQAGSAYVAGMTTSSDFPVTPDAFDTSYSNTEAFVAKLNPAGSGLAYATFLGGSDVDIGSAIAVDQVGSAYVTGWILSTDFPVTPGAFDTSHNGSADVFVAKLNPAGSDLAYATFLGGSSDDEGRAIAVDGSGSAYVTGGTTSSNFPTTSAAFDPSYNGGDGDGFVTRLDPAGGALEYGTFLGGSSDDNGLAIAVDGSPSVYVTGGTYSSNFPATSNAFDPSYNAGYDAFIARLDPAGSRLVYATFLGGSGQQDRGWAIAVDAASSVYVTGATSSSNFPTTPGAFDRSYNGYGDAFVAKLSVGGSPACCDFDEDGAVDVDDLVIIAGLWGQQAGAPYDQDGDGWITIVDIQRVARWWGWPIP